jgi:uncharacterized protein (TIGR03086 family)
MTSMPDLEPATRQMAALLRELPEGRLSAPTPCEQYTLGDLVEHIGGLSLAFTSAAAKESGPLVGQAPGGDASRLPGDWRTRIPAQLSRLAEAWRDPAAWEGTTRVGGVELPGQVAGLVGLNELVLHGWDVARAAGLPFACDPRHAEALLPLLSGWAAPGGESGREAIFGPVVEVPADAPALDRVLGLSGRDPSWTAG